MADTSVHDVLGRARRDAARLEDRRAELKARREAIDRELESVDADFARIGIVIEYCESGTGDGLDSEAPAAASVGSGAGESSVEAPPWGRQPDRNIQGLTRVEVGRRMLAEGAPLAPRAIAEAFHGTDQASRAQVESIRKMLRKLVKSGFAQMLPDGTYIARGAAGDAVQRPGPTVADTEAPAPESAQVDTPIRISTRTLRLVPGPAAGATAVDQPHAGVNGFPFAVSASVLLQLLATAGRPMRALELAQALGREPRPSQLESIRQTLRRCTEHGDAVLVERGLWAIAEKLPAEGRAGIAGAGA